MKLSWQYFLWLLVVTGINWAIADFTYSRRYQHLLRGHETIERLQEERIEQMKDWVEEWRARCEGNA